MELDHSSRLYFGGALSLVFDNVIIRTAANCSPSSLLQVIIYRFCALCEKTKASNQYQDAFSESVSDTAVSLKEKKCRPIFGPSCFTLSELMNMGAEKRTELMGAAGLVCRTRPGAVRAL